LLATLLLSFGARRANAELGRDLELARASLAEGGRVEVQRLRLLERGDITPVVLPPWALDSELADCTSLLFLAPVPTQFMVHLHPFPGLPSQILSSAGALQITRCGRERATLLGVALEMRSPRAVVHTLVAMGQEPPPALALTLPERDPGAAAPAGDPGPAPARESLAQRLRRFDEASRNAGATDVEVALLPSGGYVRLALAPGCHRLLASGPDAAPSYVLLLSDNDAEKAERLAPSEAGDVTREICTARERRVLLSLEVGSLEAERKLAVAHFPLPAGLPERFGPELAARLLAALGGSMAPQKLGSLVSASLGAQGHTPLPRPLLPQTCYVAAAIGVHGSLQTLSLGARVGARNFEATSAGTQPGPHIGFCTGRSGRVDIDVEARGLGLAWLFTLFQLAPARPETNR